MATVEVYSAAKTQALVDAAVTGGSINSDGELILERSGGAPINVGSLADPPFTVEDLISQVPFYIAHRGSGDEAPEHTMEAYRYAVGAGAMALEISVQLTADGVLVCYHDSDSIERMTGETGVISDYTYAQLKNKIKVKAQGLLGPGWEDVEIPLFEKVLEEFYGKVVLFVEPKSTAARAPLQNILGSLENSTKSIVWKSHYSDSIGLPWAKSNGYYTWAYVDTDTTSGQMDAVDGNVDFWGVPFTASDAQISMVIAHTPVKPVILWEIHRRSQRDHMLVLGIQGMMSSGFSYVTKIAPMTKNARFDLQIMLPGNITQSNNDPVEALQFGDEEDVYFTQQPNRTALMGALCPVPNDGYTIHFEMMWENVPAASLHAGVAFGKVSDDVYTFGSANASGGYHVLIRDDGDLQIYTHAPGVGPGTQIASSPNSTPTPTDGMWMEFEIEVTSSSVILRRLDSSPVVEVVAANSTYRGGYFHLIAGNTTDPTATAHFRNVYTTY